MVKVVHGQGWGGGVLWGSVLSSKARLGVILRGLALYGTVLSCPVRLSKVVSGEVFRGVALHGGVGSCPAGSSGAWLGKVRRFIARSGCAGWATVERGFVWQGTALSWQGGVEQSEVRYGKLSSWLGEVLFGVVGFIGALYSKVRSYCGMVWSVEALHRIVEFCPVKYCMVLRAKALSRLSIVRCGTVQSGFARLRAVGQALLRRHLGFVWSCDVGRCMASFALASLRLGSVLLSQVRRGPVLQGPVRSS